MSTTQTIAERPAEIRRRAFSIGETAMILGVSAVSIRRLIARGLLRPNRTLRHLRISESEITRFLAR
jgi:excisionase family DNA binding protein